MSDKVFFRHRCRYALAAGTLLLVMSTAAGTAAATEPAADSTPLPDVGTAAALSDAELRRFAEVAAEVEGIRQQYTTEVASLQQATEARMVASVQESGMTIDEFRVIFERVQADPELAERIESLTTLH